MEYDLHTQNHNSGENSSSLLNSCLSRCQTLNYETAPVCSGPRHLLWSWHSWFCQGQPQSKILLLGSVQRLLRLQVTHGRYFGILILEVQRGKEHLGPLERGRGSHWSCWWCLKWYQQLTEKNGHFHIRQITCEVKVRKKYKPTHSIPSFLIVCFLHFLLLSFFSVSYPLLTLCLPFKGIAIYFWLWCHHCFTVSSFEKEYIWIALRAHSLERERDINRNSFSLLLYEDRRWIISVWQVEVFFKAVVYIFEDLTGN